MVSPLVGARIAASQPGQRDAHPAAVESHEGKDWWFAVDCRSSRKCSKTLGSLHELVILKRGGKLDTRRVNRTVKIVCEILADEFLRK